MEEFREREGREQLEGGRKGGEGKLGEQSREEEGEGKEKGEQNECRKGRKRETGKEQRYEVLHGVAG